MAVSLLTPSLGAIAAPATFGSASDFGSMTVEETQASESVCAYGAAVLADVVVRPRSFTGAAVRNTGRRPLALTPERLMADILEATEDRIVRKVLGEDRTFLILTAYDRADLLREDLEQRQKRHAT